MKINKMNLSLLYHRSILVVLVLISILGLFIFHSRGFLSFEKVREIYEGSSLTEDLNKSNIVSTIKNEANKNQIREAYKIMVDFEKGLANEKNIIRNGVKFSEFNKSLKKTSKILYELISLPDLTSIYLVLKNKVNELHLFINSNNWKTLGRLSSRLNAELSNSNLEKNEISSFKKTQNLENILKTSFSRMIEVTNSSSLTQDKKDLILSRFDIFKTEMEMLGKYNGQMLELFVSLNELNEKFKDWNKTASLNISLKKIEFETKSKYLFYSLIGLIFLMILFLAADLYLTKFFKKNDQNILEKSILESIREGIISNRPLSGYSEEFTKELETARDYVHKKISFGSIVFDSLPFATLFLDSNLSVIWGNSIFYQVFGLEKDKKEMMTWDYVQRFTNLGENDPIHLALKNDLAGIYQVQVKKGQKEEANSFEMYVQPTIYQNQKRILLFLYPLKDLQESLANQVKSIVGPVVRTIDAMIGNQFDENFKKGIQKDFEVGGIISCFNKFSRFNELINNQRTELLIQLEKVENNLSDQFKLRNDIKEILNGTHESTVKNMMKISELKETFICNIELREKIEQNGLKIGEFAKNTNLDFAELLAKTEKMNQFVKDGLKAFDKLYTIKENIKVINQEVLKFKNKGKILNEKSDILKQREIDSFIDSFTSTMVNIETSISKIELTLKGFSEEKIDDFKERLIFSKNIFSKQLAEFKDLSVRITEFDEKMVKLFKMIYENQKETELVIKNLGILAAEGHRETEFEPGLRRSKEIN